MLTHSFEKRRAHLVSSLLDRICYQSWLFGHVFETFFWILDNFFKHFYFSKEWNYAIEVILNVLFLVGRAHRGKKNALFVQKFMVWWALSRINRARRTNVKKKAKKVGDWKTRFRNDCYRCSTSVLVFGCWLLNQVIYLKLRHKWLLLQAEPIKFLIQNGQVWKNHYF